MSSNRQSDDRSMSEILSSIRRIVSDEERTRREADEARRDHEAQSGASVFVLTDEMRGGDGGARSVDFDSPLELTPDMADRPAAPEPAPERSADAPLDLRPSATPLTFSTPVAEPEAPEAEAEAIFGEAEGSSLGEAEIEEIVRRVVREELKGPIGRQISRKVKQMIRDEIDAALAESDDSML